MSERMIESLADRLARQVAMKVQGPQGVAAYAAVNLVGWLLQHHRSDLVAIFQHGSNLRFGINQPGYRQASDDAWDNIMHDKVDALAHAIAGSRAHEIKRLFGSR